MEGQAFPPASARPAPARLERRGDTVILVGGDGNSLLESPIGSVNVPSAVGSTARRVEFADGVLFETEDGDALDRMFPPTTLWARLGRQLHAAEAFRPRLIAVVLAAAIFAVALYRIMLPLAVSGAVAATPQSLRQAADISTMATADRTVMKPTKLAVERREDIQTDFHALLDTLPADQREGAEFELLFRDSGFIGPNAMALPGGIIVLTDQLVREFDDRDLIAGVLAHEIIHVTEQHGLHRLYKSLGFFLMVTMMAGDVGPVLEEVLLEGELLLSLANSREQEAEADREGVSLMIAAGFDPEGLARFFDWAATTSPDSGWLSSHPGSEDRAARIREMADGAE